MRCLASETCQESTFPDRQLELHLLSLLQTKICEQCAVTNQIIASNQLLGGSENKQTKKITVKYIYLSEQNDNVIRKEKNKTSKLPVYIRE